MKKIKLLIIYLTIAVFAVGATGCIKVNIKPFMPADTSDAAYIGELPKKEDNIVYILESGEYVPYIAVTDDYQGQVLLLRKNVIGDLMRYTDNPLGNMHGTVSGYYPGSATDVYMNTEFLSRFTEAMGNEMNMTQIKVASYDAIYNGNFSMGYELIDRKIFSLAASEISDYGSSMYVNEGEFLKYFDDEERTIAYKDDGAAEAYWLRSAYLWTDIQAWSVGADGEYGGALTVCEYSLRPAFTVNPELEVSYINGAADGEKICVIATDTEN